MHDLSATAGPATRVIVWLGGAAFVVSLMVTLGTFYIGMGPAPAGSNVAWAAFVDVLLFSAFALHHSLFARPVVKQWLTQRVPTHLERSVYVWIASALLLAVVAGWQPLPGRAYRHSGWIAIPHWTIVLAGVWLTVRATRIIDALQLAGIRQGLGTALNDRFQIVGPYHVVRHPIYLGWMLMVFAVPDMTWTRFVFAVVSSAYLIVAIPFEERTLIETFGQKYIDYQRTVKSRIVPGLW
jgi:protein-S-isoprenylcysteine O-methyltransferase Ste14